MQGMKTLNNIKKIWGAALIGIASFMLQGCQEAAQKGDGLLMTGTSSDRLVKFAIDGFPSAYAERCIDSRGIGFLNNIYCEIADSIDRKSVV